MTLKIRGIRDKGNPEKERIVLAADSQEDIGQYVLFGTTYESDDSVSADVRNTLWLPDHRVDAGDLVVIYTKGSQPAIKEKVHEDKTKTIFIYWGIGDSIWSKEKASAVLLKVDEWNWIKA